MDRRLGCGLLVWMLMPLDGCHCLRDVSARVSIWRLLAVMTIASLGACSVARNPTVGPTPYVILDQGQVRHVYPLVADLEYWVLPFVPITGTQSSVFLTDESSPSSLGLMGKLRDMPRWRNTGTLTELAEAMGPPFPHADGPLVYTHPGPLSANTTPVRWIISADPLVVAIGTDQTAIRIFSGGKFLGDRVVLGMTFTLAGEADLDRTVTMLVVLDRWPPPWRIYGADPQKELAEKMSRVSRQIPLAGPTSLRELLRTRPWVKGT